jgi:RNA polymerase-binding transcription factor DksA
MEVITVSANPNIRVTDGAVVRNDRLVWNRLHSEREDICEALLKDSQPDAKSQTNGQRMSKEEAARAAYWHQELLQARLRKIDDALDRLMSGSYGNCSKCGRWIEDTKLDFDPALTYCVECWQRLQTIH